MVRTSLLNDLLGLRGIDNFTGESRISDTFGTLASRAQRGGAVAQPMPLDVYTTDNVAVVMAAVPGMAPDDLELTVHQNIVTVSGALRPVADTDETTGVTWYLQEIPSGRFRRSITLPFQVDADHAEASFEHGIVRVVLPKAEAARPKRIAISGGRQPTISAESSNAS